MSAPVFTAPLPGTALSEPTYTSYLPSFLSPVGNLLDRLDQTRDRLNLPEPGKHEDLGREVKSEPFSTPSTPSLVLKRPRCNFR
jgi:mitochondrial import receptor subunit TOM40